METKNYKGKRINPILLEYGIITGNLWNNEEQKEMVLKYIYELCEECNYDREIIGEFGQELKITYISMLRYAKKYATTYLNINKHDFNKRRKEVVNKPKEIVIDEKEIDKESQILRAVYEYCEEFNYDYNSLKNNPFGYSYIKLIEHAKTYAIKYLKLSETVWEEKQKLFNDSKQETEQTAKHYRETSIFLWNDETEKEKFLSYIYYFCEKYNYDFKAIKLLSKEINRSPSFILKYAKMYKEEYLDREESIQPITKIQK